MNPASANAVAGGATQVARRWLSRRLLFAVVVIAVVIAGYFAYDRFFKPQPAAAPATQQVAVSRGSVVATVSSTGSVVPAQTADLTFGTSGRLVELNASVGQSVKKGDVLARLDTTDLQLEVLKAEAQLATAEANLAKLEAGSSAGEIAQARAQVKSAQATLDKARAGATAADLQSAEAAVASARIQLQKAETDLADLKAGPTQEEQTAAKIAIEKARIALHNAQAAYDKIAWKPNAEATTEAMTLWQATTDFQAAQLAYDKAMAGPTESELNIAEQAVVSAKAALAVAEAKLATLKQGSTEAELAAAEAALIQAQTNLEAKLNPTTAAERQAARASVEQAKVAVQSAKNNLAKATITAPFDGAVAAVNGAVGQTVTGTVMTLLDLSAPLVQITVPETDVAKLEPGQSAMISLEALGGQQVAGRLVSITPKATVSSGVATYTALLALENQAQRGQGASLGQDSPSGSAATQGQGQGGRPAASGMTQRAVTVDLTKVRPGMTASATITYLRKDNVLLVPNRAIRAQGRDRVVDVLVNGVVETRVVTVGVADDQRSEIVSGLQEGEMVVVQAATTTTAASQGRNQPGGPGGFPGGFFR